MGRQETLHFVPSATGTYELEVNLLTDDGSTRGDFGYEISKGPVVVADGGPPAGDSTAPVVTAPANVAAEATGPTTPVALGTASANDDVDGPLVATPDNSGPFPVGVTVVTWSATDAAGNTGTATQNVTVRDTIAPVVTAPSDVTTESTGPTTVVAIGTATATDAVGVVSITSDAPAAFPVGTTVVTWTATDADGNQGTAPGRDGDRHHGAGRDGAA